MAPVILGFLDMSGFCSELSNVLGGYNCCCKEVVPVFHRWGASSNYVRHKSCLSLISRITGICCWIFLGKSLHWRALRRWYEEAAEPASEPFQSQLGTGEGSRVHLVLYTRSSSPTALSSADVRCPSASVWKRHAVDFFPFDSFWPHTGVSSWEF